MANQNTYQLELHVTIRPEGNFSQGLEVRETATVRAETFLEVAAILAKFHELTLTLRDRGPLQKGG